MTMVTMAVDKIEMKSTSSKSPRPRRSNDNMTINRSSREVSELAVRANFEYYITYVVIYLTDYDVIYMRYTNNTLATFWER